MRKSSGFACALMIGTLVTALASPAQAQGRCGPHDAIVKVLAGKYQENRHALGLINEKAVMEVFISPKGTWTMLVTDQRGLTCIIAAGDAWEQAPILAQGTGI
jgi:hypothetical protein